MLVLQRGKNESILVGDNIEITVLNFPTKDKVRLGITAPSDVPVHRKEVYDVIQSEKTKKQ